MPPEIANAALPALVSGRKLSRWKNGRSSCTRALAQWLFSLADDWRTGQLRVVLPDGGICHFGQDNPGPVAEIRVHNLRMVQKTLTRGTLGFCESHLDGDWDSPDAALLMELFLRNEDHMRAALTGTALTRFLTRLVHRLRPNSKAGARRNISRHYDLGNSFYRLWLDGTMTYSAALFADASEPLEQAQRRKFAALARAAGIEPGHEVLEIGCGWGGFAEYLAREEGARVTAITISDEQYRYATERIRTAGLEQRVKVMLCDYRDVQGQFDRIVSVEMIEAVGQEYWPQYFATLARLLKPGGKVGLQSITIDEKFFDDYSARPDFIQMYVFPGGMLPTKQHLHGLSCAAGLSPQHVFPFGQDYALTLRRWKSSFDAAWPTISAIGFDEKFRRMWRLYLEYCEAGFSAGTIDVVHFVAQKPVADSL